MKGGIIKKKENVKVLINGSTVPPYIDRIAESLSEIAVAGSYCKKGKLDPIRKYK
jgi:hypothetical protein